jgi:hypothetical protein
MTMKRIRLELARDHEFPSGSRERGYEFVAPSMTKAIFLPTSGARVARDAASRGSGQGKKTRWGISCIAGAAHGRLTTTPRAPTMMSPGSSSTAITLSRASTYRSPSMMA